MKQQKSIRKKVLSLLILSVIAFCFEVALFAFYIHLIVRYVRDINNKNYDFADFLNNFSGDLTAIILLLGVYLAFAIAVFVIGILLLAAKKSKKTESLTVTLGILAILSAFVVPFIMYIINIVIASVLLKKIDQQEPKAEPTASNTSTAFEKELLTNQDNNNHRLITDS